VQDGVLIEDVAPQSSAEQAGLRVGDIILTVHGKRVPNVRQFAFNMYSYAVGDRARIEVLRGLQKLLFSVSVLESAPGPQALEELLGREESVIPRLGVLVLTVDDRILPFLSRPRFPGGVLVAAKMADTRPRLGDDLAVADLIHAVNGTEINDVASLKSPLEAISSDSPIVIQVERSGKLHFVVLEAD
jgi:S1-C subfamily serine protease